MLRSLDFIPKVKGGVTDACHALAHIPGVSRQHPMSTMHRLVSALHFPKL